MATRQGTVSHYFSTYAATAADEVIYLKNNETTATFSIIGFELNSTIDTVWDIFMQTSGDATGTNITSSDTISDGSGNVTAKGNAAVTGTVVGKTICRTASLADTSKTLPVNGCILLEPGDAIAITTDATGTINVTIVGRWGA